MVRLSLRLRMLFALKCSPLIAMQNKESDAVFGKDQFAGNAVIKIAVARHAPDLDAQRFFQPFGVGHAVAAMNDQIELLKKQIEELQSQSTQ